MINKLIQKSYIILTKTIKEFGFKIIHSNSFQMTIFNNKFSLTEFQNSVNQLSKHIKNSIVNRT